MLRRKGFTLGEIVGTTGVPKTTVYGHVCDIPLSRELQERIKREATRRINEFNIRERKGKCIPGRMFTKPERWSPELIFVLSHILFDGHIAHQGFEYYNRSEHLIQSMQRMVRKVFSLNTRIHERSGGVKRIGYYNVELSQYVATKSAELLKYIQVASVQEKRIFLRAFFDDEGCASLWRNARKVRGFQYNREILKLVQTLLNEFGIESRIDEKYKELIISRKENLIRFRSEINFSRGIYINLDRKNSIWKRKLEKREILEKMIHSYIL